MAEPDYSRSAADAFPRRLNAVASDFRVPQHRERVSAYYRAMSAFSGRQTQFYVDVVYGAAFSLGFGYLLVFGMDARVAALQGGLVLGYFLRVQENMRIYEQSLEEQVAAEVEDAVQERVAAEVEDADPRHSDVVGGPSACVLPRPPAGDVVGDAIAPRVEVRVTLGILLDVQHEPLPRRGDVFPAERALVGVRFVRV
ncbi:hypothetical protein LT974_13495 [Halobacterium noricense]|uniref:hypothetical protein n=1 Tax=Halobacterium noricense TaxID=223182 RepID=UPI001E644DB0|nr:hypothetical protein [Halobacterium noricense]UHH24984.1 hypothetical protein LT974_13495 [Halobacterium noricense]